MLKLKDWIEQVLPVLNNKTTTKIEGSVQEGKVSIYWAGTIIRIDLKPTEKEK